MEARTKWGESYVKTEAAMRQEITPGATRLENTGVFSQSLWMVAPYTLDLGILVLEPLREQMSYV